VQLAHDAALGRGQELGEHVLRIGRIEDGESRLEAEMRRLLAQQRTPSAWKVLTVSPLGRRPPRSAATRSCISRAALLVKVMAAMCRGRAHLLDEVGDLVRDDARLAAAGPGEHEAGAVEVGDRRALRRIELHTRRVRPRPLPAPGGRPSRRSARAARRRHDGIPGRAPRARRQRRSRAERSAPPAGARTTAADTGRW